jgi:hypothetical protein
VGHAVRSLAAGETSPRICELADALASWAATYQKLPADRRAPAGTMSPYQAITKVAVIPPEARRSLGNITASLVMLDGFDEFAPVIGLLDTGREIRTLIAELIEVFARVYLANANSILTAIVFIHGVTSHAALGGIAAQVSDATARAALPYAWQAGCGLYACFGGGTAMANAVRPSDKSDEELIELAIANGDEHVIKFTEACLSRGAINRSPVYRAAVAHALATIRRR